MNQIEGVSVALLMDGRVLVVRRSSDDDFLAGYWEMPGGKIEPGESHEQAAEREMAEELSLEVETLKQFHKFSYQPGPNTHCTDYQYLVRLAENENLKNLRLSHEHDNYKWVSDTELDSLSPITPEARESLKLALAA